MSLVDMQWGAVVRMLLGVCGGVVLFRGLSVLA
jgi:hypothetical protein